LSLLHDDENTLPIRIIISAIKTRITNERFGLGLSINKIAIFIFMRQLYYSFEKTEI